MKAIEGDDEGDEKMEEKETEKEKERLRDAYGFPLDVAGDDGDESRRERVLSVRETCRRGDESAEKTWRKNWPGPLRGVVDIDADADGNGNGNDEKGSLSVQQLYRSYRSERLKKYLKKMCRKGVPQDLRPVVWFHTSGALVAKESARKDGKDYKDLCVSPEVLNQIELDVPRTFPDHALFQSEDGRCALKRLLVAVSQYDSENGYCQSMNYIAAFLLVVLGGDEEKAFWIMLSMIKDRVYEGTWSKRLTGCMIEMDTLSILLRKRIPKVAQHFEEIGCDVSYFATDWFLCLFCKTLPSETVARIWDCLLLEGPKILFRVALTIVKLCQKELLLAANPGDVLTIVRNTQNNFHDRSVLMDLAFGSLGSLPISKINKYRDRSGHMK